MDLQGPEDFHELVLRHIKPTGAIMANPYHHAVSSVKKWGGVVEDYLHIHHWFDESKAYHSDFRHRALRHHAQGIFECEKLFGKTLTLSTGKVLPLRWVAEQHVTEDCGYIPTLSDWLGAISAQPWMHKSRKLSKELEGEGEKTEELVTTGVS